MRLPVVAELIVIVQLSRAFCGRMSGRLPHIIHVYRLVDDDLGFTILCLSPTPTLGHARSVSAACHGRPFGRQRTTGTLQGHDRFASAHAEIPDM